MKIGMYIKILEEKCVLCGKCSGKCPVGAIKFHAGRYIIDNTCSYCGKCLSECEYGAIYTSDIETAENQIKNSYKDIWVYCEHESGNIKRVSLELLGEGKKLARQLKVRLCAVLIGSKLDEAVNEIAHYGMDRLIVVDNSGLEYYNDQLYSDVLSQLISGIKPEIVLIGGTFTGRSLAPRTAARLGTGLTADCTRLEVDVGSRILLQTRPTFGGNLYATITCREKRPQMATVRQGVFTPAVSDESKRAEIITPKVAMPEKIRARVIERVINQSRQGSVHSDIIVAFGRGIGSPSNIKLIREFADTIGASIGASRAVVDSGWIDYSHQIGQTGRTVAPKIYIALGISGAAQHIAGMISSKFVIAVNKDRNAPIFRLATLGIVGDVLEVLPLLINEMNIDALPGVRI